MAKKDYSKFYEKQRLVIERKIEKAFDKLSPASLYDPAAYIANSGGKRLRSFLVQISAKAVGSKINRVYNSAVAVELFHNFTLVHDDIMDNADKRRGLPTLHVKYDLSTAVLAGDGLIALAYKYLLKDCGEKDIDVVKDFTLAMIEVCEGQSLDKDLETAKKFNVNDYLEMIRKKTAALLQASCEIGAKLGGGTKKEVRALSNYALNLGMAFQLQDDLLDLIGDEKQFGKKVGGDLLEGKKTYLFIKAYEKAKGKDKKALDKFIQNKGAKQNEIDFYRDLFQKLGAIDDAKKLIEQYSKKAVRALKNIDEEKRDVFVWLVEKLIRRVS